MTSFAFILGVVPLVIATGAGAAGQQALGTAVFGGMIAVDVPGRVLRAGVLRRLPDDRRMVEWRQQWSTQTTRQRLNTSRRIDLSRARSA